MNTEKSFLISEELARVIFRFRKVSAPERIFPDINLTEFRILRAVKYFMDSCPEGIKVSLLSEELQVTPGRATHMINQLEEAAYIERYSHPDDRRLVLIKSTTKGLHVTEKIEKEILKKFDELVEYLGEDDGSKLISILKKSLLFFQERNLDGKD